MAINRIGLIVGLLIVLTVAVPVIIMVQSQSQDKGGRTNTLGDYRSIYGTEPNSATTLTRLLYVIGYGITAFRVSPHADLTNFRAAHNETFGCRPDSIAIDSGGHTMYLGCTALNIGVHVGASILPCKIASDGTISPLLNERITTGGDPFGITFGDGGKRMYVATSAGVFQYDVGADGIPRSMTPPLVPGGIILARVKLSPDGRFAYGSKYDISQAYQLRVNADGTLSPLSPPSIATGNGPAELRVDPNGKYVWCLDKKDGNVDRFTIQRDGTLLRAAPATTGLLHDPDSLAISNDGKYAYVARHRYNTISQFSIGSDGIFTPLTPPSVAGTQYPTTVRLDPSGRFAYVLDFYSEGISRYDIDSGGRLVNESAQLGAGNGKDLAFVSASK